MPLNDQFIYQVVIQNEVILDSIETKRSLVMMVYIIINELIATYSCALSAFSLKGWLIFQIYLQISMFF